ncbi:DUF7666 domain-containing protein [Stappia indica]|uniref:DUF7666 domain-containing protein n=1 Tax=Stappia indica TaxID=538381 RepID=UPI001CD3402D|nr:hypothetical protein [Stappia indica]MCA1298008.1 hypothetical protein [Stappia indica]
MAEKGTVITAYKGFNRDMTCRGFQYETGQTYTHAGDVVRCGAGGFHSCEMPLDVFGYYAPCTSVFAAVEIGGHIARDEGDDSKIASGEITIKASISLGDLTRKAVAWVARMAEQQGNGGYAAGNRGHASAAGYSGHASAAGYSGHASAAGESGHASAAGYSGHASAAGDSGHASAAGDSGHASAAGDYGHASAAGDYGHASAAGYSGHASAAGNRGHASAAGDSGHASAAGNRGHASAAGDYGHASVKGRNSIAAALGVGGVSSAEVGGAIMLAAYDDDDNLVAVRASLVGENGVEAGKAYRLSVEGEFIEVEAA